VTARCRVAVLGASGFVGGELLRLLLKHPGAEVTQVTSERLRGRPLHAAHPHLRGASPLTFRALDDVEPTDVVVSALAHGELACRIDHVAGLGARVVDCSADFRLDDPGTYARAYGEEHPAPGWLERFVYGLPELYGSELRETDHAAGVGCNATAINLALAPLLAADALDLERGVVADLKVGSSEAGASPSAGSHHAARTQCARSFAPTGHRHAHEVRQVHGMERLHMSVTAVDMVRGVLATCHAFLREPLNDRALHRVYREWSASRPFARVVHDRGGAFRHPDPKVLAGSNRFDLGWALDPDSDRVVLLTALDNLGKGAAGTAVQCLNLLSGFDETDGLDLLPAYPA